MNSRSFRLVALSLLCLAAGSPPGAAEPFTNRLAASADPYLLEHAHNPVDWYPWGPEAFAAAKAANKPIFLSIGYSTCFWCHVAEKTIYSNPAIAAAMNGWFVNVKVDREERPDVDRLYILATQMLTEHGAWPNNLFLTPDGKPFYAGSYFPPADDGDVPGFPKVLAAIHDLWANHRADRVEPAAEEVMNNLRALAARQAQTPSAPVEPVVWLKAAAASLVRSVDPVHGGFGSPAAGPKFPQAPALGLLAAAGATDPSAARTLMDTLDAMACGGIDDQLAGGFFRYSTDPAWSLPHYEKMLSDNAQLLALYAAAFVRTNDPLDRAVATATAGFLLRDMRLPDGGFATALDTQTDGVEGATYLWTRAAIEDVLGRADTERFLAAYELVPVPDRTPNEGPLARLARPGVLRLRLPLADTLRRAGAPDAAALLAGLAPQRAKLLAARDRRPQPKRDDKEVVALNGLAIAALADAGRALGEPKLRAAATAAATRIWDGAFDPASGALQHQIFAGKAAVDGDLSDYAMLGGGLLALAGGDDVWHGRAQALADALLRRFARPDGRLETGGTTLLPVAISDDADADVASGTSAALDLLGRLGAEPGGARFAEAEARIAARLAGRIAAHPTMWPSAVAALAAYLPGTVPGDAKVANLAVPGPVGVPGTADHVHATASLSPGPAGDRLVVTLTVDPGYHVNAHVPSLDYLVPTSLDITGTSPVAVDYPAAESFATGFSKTALAVYEGRVTLVATLPKGFAEGSGWHASVTTQACTAQTCLPPATLPVPPPRSGG